MPRPKKPRFVSAYPTIAAFVPQGIPITGEVMLSVEELEAIRLSDFEHLDQESAAKLMQVSRQTYGRILFSARSIVGEALVTGKALQINGGNYAMRGGGRRRHGRRGRMGGYAMEAGTPADETQTGREVTQMPKGDKTGPDGQGRQTGRGQGPCGQGQQPPCPQEKGGRRGGRGSGQGQGRGGGRGQGQGGMGRGRGQNR
ncbi:hypothetical protein DSCW_42430 [Desulfosarcina widdelii]|uniref:UPF0251 protein DSCW_42430 n=1 Tax=Desulfosarcina widdelii TaxID=947919 RepID=A0A5K7Z4Y0_9BACT|nr:DUF134 domain-containing protein [Desulfosarcina widdelii]BBO76826.1 hypothetical protein DSCW_42430 [Desulfosarcina widdelii]